MSESIQGESAGKSKDDLPPPRDRKGIRSVSPPLSHVSFRQFSYRMACVAAILLAFYAWRLMVWKAEVGGWWNLATGKRQALAHDTPSGGFSSGATDTSSAAAGAGDRTVEERISQLAEALGMPSKDLASAIASAVHEFVPPATLSSISAHQTGDAVRYLVDPESAPETDYSAVPIVPAATKGFQAASMAFEAAIGMDEPLGEMS